MRGEHGIQLARRPGAEAGHCPVVDLYPFGMRAGHAHDVTCPSLQPGSGKLRLLPAHHVWRVCPPLREARHDAHVAVGVGHPCCALQHGDEWRGDVDIGRLDPTLASTNHAAHDHGQAGWGAEAFQMPLQHLGEAAFACAGETVVAALLRQHAALNVEKPGAQPGGAPVDRRKGRLCRHSRPPSTISVCAVSMAEASEARNRQGPTMSSATIMRGIDWREIWAPRLSSVTHNCR
jgi:hypothetical protein